MTLYLATYDLQETTPKPHGEFLQQAIKNGWQAWILSSDRVWYRLPNTTLMGEFPSLDAATNALEATRAATAAALKIPVTMEKWIISQTTVSKFNSDQRQAAK